MQPPFKCLFCLRSDVRFTREEHPIPEALGNDDWILPPGYVCDACNQYFGSKVEKFVLSQPPFVIERIAFSVKSKKGKLPKFEVCKGLHMLATGFTDRAVLYAEEPYVSHHHSAIRNWNGKIFVEPAPQTVHYFARFLLKVGLEMLLITDTDPYHSAFDRARTHARSGNLRDEWQVGYGIYPHRQHLHLSTRHDEFGPLETRQLYDYSIGTLPSGDISWSFVYGQHVFSCNLSRPPILEHLLSFNVHNEMTLHILRDNPKKGSILVGNNR